MTGPATNIQQLKVCCLFGEYPRPIDSCDELCVILFDNAEPGFGLEHTFLVILKGTLEIGVEVWWGGVEGCDDMDFKGNDSGIEAEG